MSWSVPIPHRGGPLYNVWRRTVVAKSLRDGQPALLPLLTMNARLRSCLWVAFTLTLILARPAWAQFETATVVGSVKDSTGAVVPGAKVTLTNTQTGVTAERTSDANGNFEFFTVRIGAYVVTAEKEGFSIALVDNVQVTVGARQRVDLVDGGRSVEREGRGQRPHRAAADRLERSQPGDHRRADPGAAAQRPRVFGADAAVARRCASRRSHRRLHAARRRRSTSTACARPSTTS